jgi:hypothetical protein
VKKEHRDRRVEDGGGVCLRGTNLRQQDPASSPPRSIQARSPLLALQPAGGHNNAARSIFVGDQAWPPIRPPIQQSPAGTRDTGLSQVAPDIGVEAQRARNAFREPQDSRPPEETLAAASSCFASLMARVRPATQSRLTTTSTRPLAPAPSETAGLIVSAARPRGLGRQMRGEHSPRAQQTASDHLTR